MLCVEGISLALRAYLGIEKYPIFKTIKPSSPIQLIVHDETSQIRPFVVAAVLRNITFNQKIYESFIDLQDKLHNNICR
jgi:phenylalanyl-tRNA synthetase beta chain